MDDLHATPEQIDIISDEITVQFDDYLFRYFREFTEPTLDNAAIQIRSGNFNLDPDSVEYRALHQLTSDMRYHENTFRYLVSRLRDVRERIEEGSQL